MGEFFAFVLVSAGAAAAYFVLRKPSLPAGAFRVEPGQGNVAAAPGIVESLVQGVKAIVSGESRFDNLIASFSRSRSVNPAWLKGIIRQESNFNPDAINPEKTFVLYGTSYGANDKAGRKLLLEWIRAGNDPRVLGLNPSIGLAQIRVGTARALGFNVTARDLLDPSQNVQVAASLLAQLTAAGITLETIDAWNVGQDLKPRNFPYRDRVKAYAAEFAGDF
ncbi:MAG: hypothetical protein A4C66_10770 [Nitrospira sp. HN-bin3]|uniref:transglycosylase SLT domain-containing protein n=1 Tax=Nitrospira cf. moscoviensis SBR1015 TaxID=96242 RepID=UPI000A0B0FF4|nr:transglycosylase SLT domain-containing protein [Nitrospira cf. moscoviensis SBR1015]OQW40309.1 MAG: hypothetical protein A4C66_10770 [Nitrospira sp. HN-bin3]